MDYDAQAVKEISQGIITVFNENKDSLPYDKTIEGRIIASLGNNSYTVLINNQTYPMQSYGNTTFSINDTVNILYPQNKIDKAYIIPKGGSGGDTPIEYVLPVASDALGGIKSGTDITVDSSGNVSVNDDSHNHIISNVDGLQSALDSKASATSTMYYDAHAISTSGLYFNVAGTCTNYPDNSKSFIIFAKKDVYGLALFAQSTTDDSVYKCNCTNGTWSLWTKLSDDPHTHIIDNITGLQTALDGKIDDSQVLTNVPVNAKFTDTVYVHPTSHPYSMITGLSTVATSGSYNDLSNTPIIPASLPANGGNADTVDGYHAVVAGNDSWGTIPVIGTDGVMEVGKYIDFHATDGSIVDNDVRITATSGDLSCSGSMTATAFNGNASSATKLATSRTISLIGDVTGSTSFNGSSNSSITAIVADDSHNHIISNVDGLQTVLDTKVDNSRINNNGTTTELWTASKIQSEITSNLPTGVLQYNGTISTVPTTVTMDIPTMTDYKSNGIEVLLLRGTRWDRAIHSVDYVYGFTSATQLEIEFLNVGTYKVNYAFVSTGNVSFTIVSDTQPIDQNTNDFWYEIL